MVYVKGSGLVNLWLKDRLRAAAKQKQPLAETRLVVLTLPHLALGFAILAVGALAAGIVFMAEVAIHRWQNRK